MIKFILIWYLAWEIIGASLYFFLGREKFRKFIKGFRQDNPKLFQIENKTDEKATLFIKYGWR